MKLPALQIWPCPVTTLTQPIQVAAQHSSKLLSAEVHSKALRAGNKIEGNFKSIRDLLAGGIAASALPSQPYDRAHADPAGTGKFRNSSQPGS